jgi:hypothetical protein
MDAIVGSGKYTYRVIEEWQRPPTGLEVRACAVSVDSQDRVYCFNRNPEHPIVIFDRDGNFLSSWGAGLFTFPHAIRIVRENGQDVVWLCDEHHQQFQKFTADGRLLQTIGEKGALGYRRTVRTTSVGGVKKVTHGASVQPANDIAALDGSMFMTDGTATPASTTPPDAETVPASQHPAAGPTCRTACGSTGAPGPGADRENDRAGLRPDGKLLFVWPIEPTGPAFFGADDDDAVYIPEHNAG